MCALMVAGALIDVSKSTDAVALIMQLGYPEYFVRFIGVMKLLGITAVLLPGFPRLKEWAYAGLVFDTAGALFSHLSNGDAAVKWAPAATGLMLVAGSYIAYRLKTEQQYKSSKV